MRSLFIVFSVLVVATCGFTEAKKLQTVPLTQSTSLVFADSLLAVKIVSTKDDFTKVLSAYDRSAGMNSATPATQEVFIQHIAKNVMNWSDNEVQKFKIFSKKISPRLEELNLRLPREIILIKTTSEENGGASAAYTRQNAIMFCKPMLSSQDSVLINVLIHEIAHIYSRHNRDKRNFLYSIFSFRQSNDIVLPQEWNDRRISNPDAPALNTIIDVKQGDEIITLTPLIYAVVPIYDTAKGGGIFQSFSFKLMQVEKKDGQWQPKFFDGIPVLYSPGEITDYMRQIGKNTNYIIHPEEIMASNFVHLVNKTADLPNPEIIEKMERIISQK